MHSIDLFCFRVFKFVTNEGKEESCLCNGEFLKLGMRQYDNKFDLVMNAKLEFA